MLKKICIYISVYVPILFIMLLRDLFTLAWHDFESGCLIVEIDIHIFWNRVTLPFIIVTVIILIDITVLLFLLHRNKELGDDPVTILSVHNITAEYYLGYSSLFILSLSTFSLSSYRDFFTLTLLIALLGFVYIKNDLYYINPTINIMYGYVYNVSYELHGAIQNRTLLSKEKIYPHSCVNIVSSDYDFSFVREVHDKTN